MSIQSVEDANEYIEAVKDLLKKLFKLSDEAGLRSHAAFWLFIRGFFLGGSVVFERLINVVQMQAEIELEMFD